MYLVIKNSLILWTNQYDVINSNIYFYTTNSFALLEYVMLKLDYRLVKLD